MKVFETNWRGEKVRSMGIAEAVERVTKPDPYDRRGVAEEADARAQKVSDMLARLIEQLSNPPHPALTCEQVAEVLGQFKVEL